MNEYKKENVHGSTHTRSQSSLPTIQDYSTLATRHKTLERVCKRQDRMISNLLITLLIMGVLLFFVSCSYISAINTSSNDEQAIARTFNDRLINGHTAQDFGE